MGNTSFGSTHSGLVGFYALSMMEESYIYGSDVAHRVFELTNHTWRLGAGALYPTLNRLVEKGWAKADIVGSRKRYTITKEGRRSLSAFKAGMNAKARKYMFAWRLILDLVEHDQLPDFVIQRLKVSLNATESVLKEPKYKLTRLEKEYLYSAIKREINSFEREVFGSRREKVLRH